MISTDQITSLLGGGGNVVADDGSSIGAIGGVYLDDQTGEPEWVTTTVSGVESFIPLAQASTSGRDIRVPYGTDVVAGSPRMQADGSLTQSQEAELYRYYGLTYTEADSTTGLADSTDGAMTRSEEHLRVGTERVAAGRARLRKYIVTEQQTITVPVRREEVRLVREPITDAERDAYTGGHDIAESDHELILFAERPVVSVETVPVERVRLALDTVVENQEVTGEVRKEQIELDTSDVARRTDQA